ncbi:ORF137 [White spot syndrome virus]|uniref:ORF137 n=1 Tax=White spot syndrome virus TaxID=342409 RepID=A0A125QWT4_9VIRU|nr:ORF137 [White spot syndrome virus]ALZ45788.1 hypothetical protein [White spot syndrome virus]ASV62870.1 hypothetical protein [White spot syndrome virus]AYW76591.1 hypothetical protein [Procambarus clarkii virus]QHB92565.1 hypothetical protein [White spot syndrome virus]
MSSSKGGPLGRANVRLHECARSGTRNNIPNIIKCNPFQKWLFQKWIETFLDSG